MLRRQIEQIIAAYQDEHHQRFQLNMYSIRRVSELSAKATVGLVHEHDLPEQVEQALMDYAAGYSTMANAFEDFMCQNEVLIDKIRKAEKMEEALKQQAIPVQVKTSPALDLEKVSIYQFLRIKIKYWLNPNGQDTAKMEAFK